MSKQLSVLIKPASALCNIRCKYCFYADVSDMRQVKSHGKMKEDVMEKMIDNIFLDLNPKDTMTFAFQGGEPTVAGLEYFKKFVAYVDTKNPNNEVIIKYAIQTNGLLITDEWCQLFVERDFLVGLSMDLDPRQHDGNRVDARGRGTFERVKATKHRFEKFGVEFNILSVLTNQLARHPQKVWNMILREDIKYVQFIPCLDDLEDVEDSYFALTPERFATFYNGLFPLWKTEFEKGNYISVNLFDNVVNLLSRGIIGSCGMLGACQPQFVIESNGSVYPCDFYVLDEYLLGYVTEKPLLELYRSPAQKEFLKSSSCNNVKDYCKECPFFNMCRGGCKRMNHAMYLNRKEDYCGYQDFLSKNIEDLQYIASGQK